MSADGSLSPAERKALKARAHAIEPVVWIGDDGVSDAVVSEIDRALAAHELIKARAAGLARGAREAALVEICARCAAQPVQHIGKVLVLYRKRPEAEKRIRRGNRLKA
jgi:putative YhbY family RNA-binding protein